MGAETTKLTAFFERCAFEKANPLSGRELGCGMQGTCKAHTEMQHLFFEEWDLKVCKGGALCKKPNPPITDLKWVFLVIK